VAVLTIAIITALLVAINALYVAGEFAAVGVRRSRVRRLAEDGNYLAGQLRRIVDDRQALDGYVGACQIGITVSSLLLGAYSQAAITPRLVPVFQQYFELSPAAALSWAAAAVLVVLTALQLVLGELIPKTLALQYPTNTALATVLPVRYSLVAFRPLLAVLNGVALKALHALGAGEHGHHHLHSPEELDLLIAESRDGGLLEPEEQQRLRAALHLGKRTAADLMVPLQRLTSVDESSSWQQMLQTALASPFSRLPVFRGSREAIVGTLRVKDVVERHAAGGPAQISALMRPVIQVPAALPADQVLSTLREKRAHSAVVVGPDGSAAGWVTIQDVLSALLEPPAELAATERRP
jgi:putative hemolysin